MDTSKICQCYVKNLPPEVRFGLHYGTHALDCPVYRVSRDPVDVQHDSDVRARYQMALIQWIARSAV